MGHLGRIVINAIAIAVAAYFIPGMTYGTQHLYGLGDADRWISLALTALVLGIVNALVFRALDAFASRVSNASTASALRSHLCSGVLKNEAGAVRPRPMVVESPAYFPALSFFSSAWNSSSA